MVSARIIEEKGINFVVDKYEPSKGRKAKNVSKERCGYDVESDGRKIEVKATSASIPNKTGFHITLLPHQFEVLENNPNYWIYRVYNVLEKGKEKVVPVSRDWFLKNMTTYKVHKLTLSKEDWEKLKRDGEK